MRMPTRPMRIVVAAVCLVLTVASCGEDNRYADVAVAATAGSGGNADINGDGKVVISVLSPGDLEDNGYYESFVGKASAFAARQGWTLKRHGKINPANALADAKKFCTEDKPDLVAMGASEIADAVKAAKDPACGKAYWYVPAGGNIKIQPEITISQDFINEGLLTAGYANGLLMQDKGYDKAGYITGPEADFSIAAAKAFIAGIRMVIPTATLDTKFTGDFNDGTKAAAAMQEQVDEGIRVSYPYLGGATDQAAAVGNKNDVILSTPGTNRCDSTNPRFDVSVIFDPGEYFAAALEDFANGELKMGVTRNWHLGVDTVPTVRLCNGTDTQNAKLAQFISNVGSGVIKPDAKVAELGNIGSSD